MRGRKRARKLVVLLAIGACHLPPIGGDGGCFPEIGSCEYGPGDGGEVGPGPTANEFACQQRCEDERPGTSGFVSWNGVELACECRRVFPANCKWDDCVAGCAARGYDHATCDETLGCRCHRVPAADGDADMEEDAGEEDVDAVEEIDEVDDEEFEADEETEVTDDDAVEDEDDGAVDVEDDAVADAVAALGKLEGKPRREQERALSAAMKGVGLEPDDDELEAAAWLAGVLLSAPPPPCGAVPRA